MKETLEIPDQFAKRLLSEEKVAVVPGAAFGPSGKGFVGSCYATSLPNIEEALRRMDSFVRRVRRAHGSLSQ